MATVNGTTSQNTSKYDFYMTYSTSFDSTKMQHKVTVNVYLDVIKYKYSGTTSHKLKIGGVSVDEESSYKKTCGDNSRTKTYKIASGSKTYSARTTERSVTIEATMTAPSDGYGPGTCKVSKKITLPAKLSTAGALAVSSMSTHTCTLKVSSLKTGLGYSRTGKFYYKLDSATSWTLLGSKSIPSADSSISYSTPLVLMPNRKYDFKCAIVLPSGSTSHTVTTEGTSDTDNFSLSKSALTQSSVKLAVNGLIATCGRERVLKLFYRRKGASSWTALTAKNKTFKANSNIGTPVFSITGCTAGTAYEAKVECYYGSYRSAYATIAFTTVAAPVVEPDEPTTPETPKVRTITATLDGSMLTIKCTDTTGKTDGASSVLNVYLGQFGWGYNQAGQYFNINYHGTFEIPIMLVAQMFPSFSSFQDGDPVKLIWTDNTGKVKYIDQLELIV